MFRYVVPSSRASCVECCVGQLYLLSCWVSSYSCASSFILMLDMIQKSLPRVVRVNNKNNAMVYSSFILMRRNRWFCICREFEWVLQNYLHTHHSFQNVEFSFGSWSVRTWWNQCAEQSRNPTQPNNGPVQDDGTGVALDGRSWNSERFCKMWW